MQRGGSFWSPAGESGVEITSMPMFATDHVSDALVGRRQVLAGVDASQAVLVLPAAHVDALPDALLGQHR